MNKKFILTSILAISFAMPAFARAGGDTTPTVTVQPGVGGSEQCDSATLGQSENNSTANVEADWTANTININWRDNGVVIAQNTCTYDGTITLPQEPTKTGYTFAGWVLAQDLATVCHSINNQQTCTNTTGCGWWEDTGECLTTAESTGRRMLCRFITEQACTNTPNCAWNSDTETCGPDTGGLLL